MGSECRVMLIYNILAGESNGRSDNRATRSEKVKTKILPIRNSPLLSPLLHSPLKFLEISRTVLSLTHLIISQELRYQFLETPPVNP